MLNPATTPCPPSHVFDIETRSRLDRGLWIGTVVRSRGCRPALEFHDEVHADLQILHLRRGRRIWCRREATCFPLKLTLDSPRNSPKKDDPVCFRAGLERTKCLMTYLDHPVHPG